MPTLVAGDDREPGRQAVDDLAFPFIAPLRAEYRNIHTRNQSIVSHGRPHDGRLGSWMPIREPRARIRDVGDTRQASLFACTTDENRNAKKVKQELF
jgi:hypothetical protein